MKRLLTRAAPLLTLAGCSGIQSPLAPAGDEASALSSLFVLMMIVCGIIYLLVMGSLAIGVRRAMPARAAATSDAGMERALWGWAGIIIAGLVVLIVGSFLADRALFAQRGREALLIRVTGHQWWWRIQYLDPASGRWIETANELHLPRGKTARVALGTSDVIHSFWVPNVAGKLDTIPGRRNTIDLTPRVPGWFRGQCTEFCGAQHAHMAFDVKVDEPAEFDAWLAAQARPAAAAADSLATSGTNVFDRACASCHAIRGTAAAGRAGPDLTHIGARRSIAAGTLPMSRGNLQGWIAQPQAIKPGTAMPTVPLAPADANAVAYYLASLK